MQCYQATQTLLRYTSGKLVGTAPLANVGRTSGLYCAHLTLADRSWPDSTSCCFLLCKGLTSTAAGRRKIPGSILINSKYIIISLSHPATSQHSLPTSQGLSKMAESLFATHQWSARDQSERTAADCAALTVWLGSVLLVHLMPA